MDWANFGPIQIGRARRALSCFVLVLSWSRAVHARFALEQTLESLLRGHVEAFTAMTGAALIIVDDGDDASVTLAARVAETGPSD